MTGTVCASRSKFFSLCDDIELGDNEEFVDRLLDILIHALVKGMDDFDQQTTYKRVERIFDAFYTEQFDNLGPCDSV